MTKFIRTAERSGIRVIIFGAVAVPLSLLLSSIGITWVGLAVGLSVWDAVGDGNHRGVMIFAGIHVVAVGIGVLVGLFLLVRHGYRQMRIVNSDSSKDY